MNGATSDAFNAVLQIVQLDETALPAPQVLHERLRGAIDGLFQRAAQAGFSREDVNDLAYAVVALADEVVLAKSAELREYWIPNLLQLHYFHENVAGEAFFTRLETVRRDPRRREVLRAYFLALSFGFQGRYRVRGGDAELLVLTEGVQRELMGARRFDGETLSPSGARPDEAVARSGRGGPLVWMAGAALGLTLLLYVGLRVTVSAQAGSVIDRIDAAAASSSSRTTP